MLFADLLSDILKAKNANERQFQGVSMKKYSNSIKFHTVWLFMLPVLGILLCACHGPRYEESEKEELERKGEDMMQEWLSGHMSGTNVTLAEANVLMIPSGPEYLTDYVAGTVSDGKDVRDYLINVRTDNVYLMYDSTLLTEVCLDHVLEKLNLDSYENDCDITGPSAALWLPDNGNSYHGTQNDPDLIWLPGDLTLSLEEAGHDEKSKVLENFVRSDAEREVIEFEGEIHVPDEVDLKKYDMAYFTAQQEENGIAFQYFHISDTFENVSVFGNRASYERYCFQKIDDPDIQILMKAEYREESKEDDGIKTVEDKKYNPSDLSFESTTDGYLVTFPDYEHIFEFSVYADKGSDFLKHEYLSHEDRQAYLSPGSRIGGERYSDIDLYWKETKDDRFLLTDKNGVRKLFFGGEELIPRE